MGDVAVEVCGENGAYYKAYITDVHENEITVAFEYDWQPESTFPYNRVRLPPAAPKHEPVNITDGQEVEVFSRANEQEACGWWPALVKMTKRGFHVVEYLGWETTYTEIVPTDRLRLKNTNQPITEVNFNRFEIPVPEDVQEYSKLESAHKEFKKAIGAALCKYNADKKSLQIIFVSSPGKHKGLEKRAHMLRDMHFRSLRQKVQLLNRTEEAARQLESTRLHSNSGHEEDFVVREDPSHLAIDAHDTNIQNTRNQDSIAGISLEERSCTFNIFGEDRILVFNIIGNGSKTFINGVNASDPNNKVQPIQPGQVFINGVDIAAVKNNESIKPEDSLKDGIKKKLECPVCLESMEAKVVVTSECGHLTCEACMNIILGGPKEDRKCPKCRKTIKPDTIRKIYL